MKLFNLDSPLMKFLSRMTDILWLNILVLIFFVPPGAVYYLFASAIVNSGAMPSAGMEILIILLVILAATPIGAAFTAMHYVLLKMVRDEEGYITKDFFKSFKLNFRQATIIWGVAMIIIGILIFNFTNIQGMKAGTLFFAASAVAAIFVFGTLLYVFPVLSHFENSIKGTVRNSFFMSILALPRTVVMMILTAVPLVIIYLVERFEVMVWLIPLTMLFWFSLPAYYCAKLYDKTFKRFEPETAKPADDMEWTVSASEEGEETKADSADENADSSAVEVKGEGDKENSSEE